MIFTSRQKEALIGIGKSGRISALNNYFHESSIKSLMNKGIVKIGENEICYTLTDVGEQWYELLTKSRPACR